ncbi:hypothetical protein [Kitasatospora sp. GP82]|uniref:hypothetical protein n=1 Tax=Kitasatospora sp. GP82 TaxID=3035089 RepID=UPI002475CE9E|nr:hypothetical protein [Kitasatospora sp. GP82]MDH6125787.1 hypothetical protein [Kitasatospora sp. GP82]
MARGRTCGSNVHKVLHRRARTTTLPITTSHPDGYLWKRNHVADWLATAPAVWIDDDFTPLDHQ